MHVYDIKTTDTNNKLYSYQSKPSVKNFSIQNTDSYKRLSPLNSITFRGLIPVAQRLKKSDYLISGYIKEIGKARDFHGVRSVVDLSMGNPDLTPPENAKSILKMKVNDLWSHRYNNPKGEGVLFHTVSETNTKMIPMAIDWIREQGYEILPICDIVP